MLWLQILVGVAVYLGLCWLLAQFCGMNSRCYREVEERLEMEHWRNLAAANRARMAQQQQPQVKEVA